MSEWTKFDKLMIVLIGVSLYGFVAAVLPGVIAKRDALAAKSNFGNVVVKWVRTYDGDTSTFNLPSWPPIIGKKISVRILGIDTPEIRGKCSKEKILAVKARDVVRAILDDAKREGKTIELRNMRRGKYFRILANVYVEEMSIAKFLIYQGLARVYDGGKRKGWCGE